MPLCLKFKFDEILANQKINKIIEKRYNESKKFLLSINPYLLYESITNIKDDNRKIFWTFSYLEDIESYYEKCCVNFHHISNPRAHVLPTLYCGISSINFSFTFIHSTKFTENTLLDVLLEEYNNESKYKLTNIEKDILVKKSYINNESKGRFLIAQHTLEYLFARHYLRDRDLYLSLKSKLRQILSDILIPDIQSIIIDYVVFYSELKH